MKLSNRFPSLNVPMNKATRKALIVMMAFLVPLTSFMLPYDPMLLFRAYLYAPLGVAIQINGFWYGVYDGFSKAIGG